MSGERDQFVPANGLGCTSDGIGIWRWRLRWRQWTAVPTAAAWQEETLVSRRVSCACLSSTATLPVKGVIGRNIKNTENDVQPKYATRRCSRTLRPRRTVPFASCRCQ